MKPVTIVSTSHTPHSAAPLLRETTGSGRTTQAAGIVLSGNVMAACAAHAYAQAGAKDDRPTDEKFPIVSLGGKAASTHILPYIPAAASRLVKRQAGHARSICSTRPVRRSFRLKAVYSITPEPPLLLPQAYDNVSAKRLDYGNTPWAGASVATTAGTSMDDNELLAGNLIISGTGTDCLIRSIYSVHFKTQVSPIHLHIWPADRQCETRHAASKTCRNRIPARDEILFRGKTRKLSEKKHRILLKPAYPDRPVILIADERLYLTLFFRAIQFLSASPDIRTR